MGTPAMSAPVRGKKGGGLYSQALVMFTTLYLKKKLDLFLFKKKSKKNHKKR
jgi:hypothetical protein